MHSSSSGITYRHQPQSSTSRTAHKHMLVSRGDLEHLGKCVQHTLFICWLLELFPLKQYSSYKKKKNQPKSIKKAKNRNAERIAPVKENWKSYLDSSTEVTKREKGSVWKTKVLSVKIWKQNSETGISDDQFKCISFLAPHFSMINAPSSL